MEEEPEAEISSACLKSWISKGGAGADGCKQLGDPETVQ